MTAAELRTIMEKIGVSQTAFAALLGTSQCSISHYLANKTAISRKVEDKARELAGMPPLPPLPPVMSGAEFRALRKAAGLSQPELGARLRRTNYYVSRAECGATCISDKIAAKMRQLFGHLVTAPQQSRAPRKPPPFCGVCMCWNAAPGLPCGCPGGHPGTNGASSIHHSLDISIQAV